MPDDPGADLRVDISGPVATLTLNRPQVRNALTMALRRRLVDTVTDLDADATVRVIVLTGADPAFCAGMDTRELSAGDAPADLVARDAPFLVSTTPLIGAVNGPAYTGGLELALSCHLLVASDRATFADTHARLGLTPGMGLTVLLPEAVGEQRARQMMLTCAPITARTAMAWGLVTTVVPHDELLPAAHRIAADIAANDAHAVSSITRTLNQQAADRQREAWAREADGFLGARPEPVRP
jgi:enoyl-CoA hydratase